ncbi:MAG: transporter [Coriobacteriia bacterium]|nr:transporter [Coriobacteriia bacterium]
MNGINEAPAKKPRWITYVLLHAIILLYTVAAICSKMAALEQFASIQFFAWYAAVLVILFLYAIVWQQILKRLPLTTAFANKGVTVIWGLLWGALLFAENISIGMIVGAVVVLVGIILVVTSDD